MKRLFEESANESTSYNAVLSPHKVSPSGRLVINNHSGNKLLVFNSQFCYKDKDKHL